MAREKQETIETNEQEAVVEAIKALDPTILKAITDMVKAQVKDEVDASKTDEEKEGELSPRLKRLQASEKVRVAGKKTIELFQDGDKYKDDVFVGVNGVNTIIQRGIPVEVPVAVADIVENAQKQANAAAKHNKGLQDQFNRKKDMLE